MVLLSCQHISKSTFYLNFFQVKVWFQNRRTKYKRTKSETDGGVSGDGQDPKSPFNDSKSESDISDVDDIDDVGDEYPAHAYPHAIQTC